MQPSHSRQKRQSLDFYFKPKDFELADDARFYERLGMRQASEFFATPFFQVGRMRIPNLLCNPIGMTNQMKFGLPNPEHTPGWASKEENLRRVDKGTRLGEAGHVALAAFGIVVMTSQPLIGAAFALGNAYVAGIHRYNRARIYSILNKLSKKKPKQ